MGLPDDPISRSFVQNALESWNIVPDDILPISTNGNCHWKVLRARDTFVVRMYRRGQSNSSTRYELEILNRLHRAGWPVAAALDETVVESGLLFALFPWLPGRPNINETPEQMQRRGRILAALHTELRTTLGIGQRTGWQRADEVARTPEMNILSGGDTARKIASHLDRARSRLDAVHLSSFPATIIHGDFIAQNLLFEREKLSGVLDFDSVHLDLRAADLACARRSSYNDVVRGYLEVSPLTDAELGCLDDLWRASVLRYALQILRNPVIIDDSELQWCVRQLEKTVPFD
jgi:Ser/Thr protein kinase RdoA (MazF antagonist)